MTRRLPHDQWRARMQAEATRRAMGLAVARIALPERESSGTARFLDRDVERAWLDGEPPWDALAPSLDEYADDASPSRGPWPVPVRITAARREVRLLAAADGAARPPAA
jgi:hypothetical protein